jgi:hypothetical protein
MPDYRRRAAREAHSGHTPAVAVGATDQHSQLQLCAEMEAWWARRRSPYVL